MRAFFIGFLFFTAFVYLTRQYALCKIWHQCDDRLYVNSISNDAPVLKNTTSLYYSDSLLFGGFERFKLTHTSQNATLSENNRLFIRKAIDFLEKNPNVKLCIVGSAFMNEPVTAYYESEGLRRADLVRKAILTIENNHKINEKQVEIDDIITVNDIEPQISFKLLPVEVPLMSYRFKKMTFYSDNFIEGDATLQPKSAFINYSDSLRLFTAAHQNTKIAINSYITDKSEQKTAFERTQILHQHFMALGLLSNNIKLNIIVDATQLAGVNNLQPVLKNQRFEIEIK
ncbi:MAG: hypothetical protein RI894_457 [Bacteroidota bacterium]|jgi:hypothetical protein